MPSGRWEATPSTPARSATTSSSRTAPRPALLRPPAGAWADHRPPALPRHRLSTPPDQGSRPMERIDVLEERLADVPLFAGLSGGHRRVIAELAHRVEVPAGATLTVQGQDGRDFMIVLEGDVEVRAGDAVVTTLPGSYFGEIALLDDRPRTATLTARTPMVLEVIRRSAVALALAEVPGLSDELRDAMARRLQELDGDTAR